MTSSASPSVRSRVGAVLSSALLLLSPLAARPGLAQEVIVDNADSAVAVQGTWSTTTTTPGFHGADYRFRTAGDGSATFRWPFPDGAGTGRFEVFARWSGGPNRATNATYSVAHAGGTARVTANQKEHGGTWRSLGTYDFQPGKGQGVTLNNQADGVVVADAIRWVGVPSSGQGPSTPQMQAIIPPTVVPAPTRAASASGGAAVPAGGASTSAPQPTATPAAGTPAAPTPTPTRPADPRFFEQTRYRVDNDAIWDFFRHRGGVRTFGYPVSNTFTLLGMKVQMFQRQVLQVRPDGGVQTMNLLDDGLLPYTKIHGSTFPAADPEVLKQTPSPAEPDYHERALQFVREVAPDEFDGHQVNFARTFFSTVRAEDAFPNGAPEDSDGLLSGFNLEIWGLPTSRPTYDPTNRGFIYQRFQRGIMHFDKACGCTQGLLLADHLKALALNRNVPPDLAAQAKDSRFLGQWAPGKPLSLSRPQDMPGSDWSNAFRRDPTVLVDAGHGAKEIGASHTFKDGHTLLEKALNLRVALRLRELLEQEAGYQVVMSRTTDTAVNTDQRDLTGDGKVTVSDDLQARVDLANRSKADILVSVHFNGIANPNMKGTFTFWAPERPFSDRSKALAESVQTALVRSMKEAGYTPVDRGARTDQSVLGGGHYFLLGPQSDVIKRPSEMPGIIGEALFLTNEDDANAARNERIVEAVARGYLEGIKAYFARFPAS